MTGENRTIYLWHSKKEGRKMKDERLYEVPSMEIESYLSSDVITNSPGGEIVPGTGGGNDLNFGS